MSASTLREAIEELRRDAGVYEGPDHDFTHAVADWLAWVADAAEGIDGLALISEQFGFARHIDRKRSEMFAACERHAITVAYAYLGDAEVTS